MSNKNKPSLIEDLVAVLIFPLVMSVSLGACYWGIQQGYSELPIVLAIVIPMSLFLWIIENMFPYRAEWNKADDDVKTDFIHLFIVQTILPRLVKPLWIAMLASVTIWAAQASNHSTWPHDWPLLAQLFLMLVIAEFGRYWVHRAAHEIPLLWRFHAVHHSPNRLYFLNAARFHPVEKAYLLIPEVIPFIILGTNAEILTMYFVFNGLHGYFQHSNIRLRLGPLNYIFSMTELHRWHHSKIIEESNTNYGNNLIIWDVIFGTFFLPKNRDVASIGVYNAAYPKDYIGQIKAPFVTPPIDKPADYEERSEYYSQKIREEAGLL